MQNVPNENEKREGVLIIIASSRAGKASALAAAIATAFASAPADLGTEKRSK